MMKIYLYLISFILSYYFGECVQPYFPTQITFTPDDGQTIYAIDEINQRAYKSIPYSSSVIQVSYAMKHFPFAIPDSPESKYYVQLTVDSPPIYNYNCQYGTFWKYGERSFNTFPSYWLNGTSFEIKNYLNFNYEMIHSNDSTIDEDYWYSNVTCQIGIRDNVPCQEIFFKKNTEIPLRLVQVVRQGWNFVQVATNYKIISIGKPDEKYFDSIPKNWSVACRDVNLALLYHPQLTQITLNQSSIIYLSLTAPPHRINGSDTVRITWKPSLCTDCVTWTPTELTFNTNNFQKEQILTVTRVKDGSATTLIPNFSGGAYEFVPSAFYQIVIE